MNTSRDIPDYTEQYGTFLTRAKEIAVNFDGILKIEKVRFMFNDLIMMRRELTELFSKTLGQNCKSCQGRCCKQYVLSGMTNEDILLCRLANFDFPVPDFDFLKKRKEETKIDPCLFLGGRGCLLGEFKPFCCFDYLNLRECDYEENVTSGDLERIERLLGTYRKFSLSGF